MPMSPAPTVLAGLKQALAAHAPFAAMPAADVERIVVASEIRYFAPGEVVLEPSNARPDRCYVIRQGTVRGERLAADGTGRPMWVLAPGEMFPVAAHVAKRGVTSRYRAEGDVFCLAFPAALFDRLAAESPVFQDFCARRLAHLLDLSRAEVQAAYTSGATEARDTETPLASLLRQAPVTVPPSTPIGAALERMEAGRIGSLPVVAADGTPLGIFTRQDVIGRIVLPRVELGVPIERVMSAPVITLPRDATASDAAVAMARHAIRHVVVTDAAGRVSGVVSERDLFALQRLSVRELSSAIRRAPDVLTLAVAAADIRSLSYALVAQGVASGPLTRMISSLNDVLTARALDLVAGSHDLAGVEFCWLGMGSEGRSEQTIATDQDNGIVFTLPEGAVADGIRARLLPFALAVNEALAECGYPLCKGGVMASNPRWCLSLDEWRGAFGRWIDHGDPQSLLDSAIFFDFRPLWGEARLARELRADIAARAARNARFLKQMSDNALGNRPPLNWFGDLAGKEDASGEAGIDLKRSGSMPFVDAARIFALASGVAETNTIERLRAAGAARGVREDEIRDWIDAFEFVQLLRLRTQHRRGLGELGPDDNPNVVPLGRLSALDRRILRESIRQVERIQQRLSMDYPG